MLCLWHLYWTSVAGCLCCLRDVLSSRCRYASGAMVSTVYLRYINTCYCTYLWIFLMYTFFQKKKKRLLLKTFLQFKLARRVRSRFSTNFDLIEAEGVLRPYTATQLTDVGRTSLPFGFFDFMVLFNMRHLFFDFFVIFFLTTMFVVGSILNFFDGVLLFNFLHISCVRFFSCFLFLKPSDPQIISLVIARHMSQHQKRNTSCCLMVCRIPVLLEGLHQPQMWFCCNPPSKCAGKDQTQDAIEHRCHCCWFVFWLHADSPLVEGCRKLADAWCLALHYCTAVFWDTKDIPSTVDFVHLNTV